jgi:hypothetical protein
MWSIRLLYGLRVRDFGSESRKTGQWRCAGAQDGNNPMAKKQPLETK